MSNQEFQQTWTEQQQSVAGPIQVFLDITKPDERWKIFFDQVVLNNEGVGEQIVFSDNDRTAVFELVQARVPQYSKLNPYCLLIAYWILNNMKSDSDVELTEFLPEVQNVVDNTTVSNPSFKNNLSDSIGIVDIVRYVRLYRKLLGLGVDGFTGNVRPDDDQEDQEDQEDYEDYEGYDGGYRDQGEPGFWGDDD